MYIVHLVVFGLAFNETFLASANTNELGEDSIVIGELLARKDTIANIKQCQVHNPPAIRVRR